MKIYGDEKPSLEELAHHGVKGQRWGVHKKTSSRVSDAVRKRNAEIDAARHRINTGRTSLEYKQAKAKYKTDKKIKGRAAAKVDLREAQLKRARELDTARRTKVGSEAVIRLLAVAGSISL